MTGAPVRRSRLARPKARLACLSHQPTSQRSLNRNGGNIMAGRPILTGVCRATCGVRRLGGSDVCGKVDRARAVHVVAVHVVACSFESNGDTMVGEYEEILF